MQVVLYRGINHDGREFFAYIRCDKKGYNAMQSDYENDRVAADLSSYGESIYVDFKTDPNPQAEFFLEHWLKTNS